jgi:DNA polymerase III epsilon subunit-like protein/predicted phage-related endonuclease
VQEHKIDEIETSSQRKLSEQKLDELIKLKDNIGLMEYASLRANSESYLKVLNERDKLRSKLSVLDEEYKVVKGYSPNRYGKKVKDSRVAVRESSLAYREVFEKLAEVQTTLNNYRQITARAASASAKIREEHERKNGSFLEFTGDCIGDLVAMGEFESGSEEWHAVRADGIGGSDVGAIMKVDEEYATVNYRRVLSAKLGEVEENISEVVKDEYTAIGRGNAWEEAIRQMCADRNPHLRIAFCKTSWAGKGYNSYRRANFDGLILNEEGVPEGVIEVKTGSDKTKWKHTSLGLFGVPPGYRKQVLWYAALAGLRYGKIVVLLDDNDYREYNFDMNDIFIQKEIDEIMSAMESFWKKLLEMRENKASGLSSTKSRVRGFAKELDFERISQILAFYSNSNPFKVKKELLSEVLRLEEELDRPLEASENQELLVRMFAAHNPATRNKPLYGVDIETSRASPRNGRIIESGIAELVRDTAPRIIYSELHGVPESVKRGVGIGFKEVHGITAEDLDGKPLFSDPSVQKEILERLKSGVMVAHNAIFEDRFFTVELDGYAEARDSGEIEILDTRIIATLLMPESEDSSLNSFAEDNGVPYEGAHAAAADALMMMKALQNLQKTLYTKGKFSPKRVTKVSRRAAIKEAIEAEAAR